jgi:tol-pal system protein YbgF
MNDLRDDIMGLRGAQEEGQYEMQKGETGLSRLEARCKQIRNTLNKSQQRVARIEKYLGMHAEKPVGSTAGKDAGIKEKSEVEKSPEGLYQEATRLLEKGEYEEARRLFRSFLDKYPKAKEAGSAQYSLGEIYFREKWYEKAILEYQKVIEGDPKGDKTPGALLKQGLAFLRLDDTENARLILKELIRKFPDSNETTVAKNKLKTLR